MTPEELEEFAKLNLKANFAGRIQNVSYLGAAACMLVAIFVPHGGAQIAALVCAGFMYVVGMVALVVWRNATMRVFHISYEFLQRSTEEAVDN